MSIEDQHPDVLQNIEVFIVRKYHQYPSLTDYDVDKAIEALIRTYRNDATDKPEVLPRGDLAKAVYAAVKSVCEWRLGRDDGISRDVNLPENPDPISMDVMILCLKRIRKSIAMWTKEGGRQGYLMFIEQFIG
jgi:hypothetical protein